MNRARRAHLARLERLARTPRPSLRPLTRDELRSMSDAVLVAMLAELDQAGHRRNRHHRPICFAWQRERNASPCAEPSP